MRGSAPLKVALVAMPWNRVDSPSTAVGVLAAVIRNGYKHFELDTRLAYLALAKEIGVDTYAEIADSIILGDLIYAAHLYPENKERVREYFAREMTASRLFPSSQAAESEFDHIYTTSNELLSDLVSSLSAQFDVVGFTTTFVQLFPSLAAASRLKAINPAIKIVLGGWAMSVMGTSIATEFPFIDYVIKGDAEEQFPALLQRIESGDPEGLAGVGPFSIDEGSSPHWADLNTLPLPSYEDYAALARDLGDLDWSIPIEGSRGCWWDRVRHSGNPLDSCRFCINNGNLYREKSASRVAGEMDQLSDRHANRRFSFTDSVLRSRGIEEWASGIKRLGKRLSFFQEIRATIDPRELLLLWEAGCREVQIGIEGFSSSYLRRLGKGTTTIQNLQAMKTCFELGIDSHSNLVTDFPGATEAEIEEIAENILNIAIAYQPLILNKFCLQRASCVQKYPDMFPVANIRNADAYRTALPESLWSRLELPVLDYDAAVPAADWSRVYAALEEWNELHKRIRQDFKAFFVVAPLYYEDWDIYLSIVDRRHGRNTIELRDAWRDLYLYCVRIRAVEDINGQFAGQQDKVEEMLQALVSEKLMFAEETRYLSLAVATSPDAAARMIRLQSE